MHNTVCPSPKYVISSLPSFTDIIASLVTGIRRINIQEGNTVALQPQIPKTKSDDMLLWSFNPDNTQSKSVIVKSQMLSGKITTEYKGSFKDQLVLERNTGSLTIRNITTSLSGRYSLQIIGDDGSISDRHFYCFVYGEWHVSVFVMLVYMTVYRGLQYCMNSQLLYI